MANKANSKGKKVQSTKGIRAAKASAQKKVQPASKKVRSVKKTGRPNASALRDGLKLFTNLISKDTFDACITGNDSNDLFILTANDKIHTVVADAKGKVTEHLGAFANSFVGYSAALDAASKFVRGLK